MADGLRVLYVDDEPELLEMAKTFLEMDGEFSVGISTSAKEVIGLPLALSYDAIVSDYEMPVMNGIAFLKSVREQFGDIPFILFTGRGREEVVIDAINNGADFYLQKGGSARAQFAELSHKIRQAVVKRRAQTELREAINRITASEEELARSERQLQESENKFRDFADHLPQMVFETDMDLRITYVNKYTIASYGFPAEAVGSGLSILTFIHPSQHATFMESVHHLRYGIPFAPREYTAFDKEGKPFPVIVYSSPIFRNKQMVGFRGVVADISARKQAETALRESEEKYRLLVEVNQDIIYSLEEDGTIRYVSPQVSEQLGYQPGEMEGKNFQEFIHPDDAGWLLSAMTQHIRRGSTPMSEQFRVRCRDDTYRWYEDKTIYTSDRSGRRLAIGTIRDITERKAADDALFASRQMLQGVLDAIPQCVFWKDIDQIYLGCNMAFAVSTGHDRPEDIVGRTDYDLTTYETAEKIREEDHRIMETDRPCLNHEDRYTWSDGSQSWLKSSKLPLRDRAGETMGILGLFEDVTEQKMAENALVESEARFRDLTERLPQMVFETDRELRITYANRHAALMSGYSAEELTAGLPVLSLIKPAQHARFMESVKSILMDLPFEPKEYTALRKDGSTFPVVVYSSPIYRNQEIVGFRGVAIDISSLRKMEAGIRESEEKFRSLVENASDIVFSLDKGGNFTYISPQWRDMLGHDPEKLIGTPSVNLIHPDDAAGNIRAFRRVMEEGTRIGSLEYRIRHKDGTWRWHSQSAAPVRNASGKIVAYQGICHDISRRKQTEKALRENEARLRLLTDNVKDVIWTADMEMHLTYVTPSVHELRGMTPEEAIAQPIEEALTPDSLAVIRNHFCQAKSELENGKIMPAHHPLELEFRRKDGSTVWTEVMITPMLGKDGLPAGVIGLTRDISQRRASETALRESESMFSTIFRTSLVALTLLSVKDNTFYAVNDAFIKNSGYSREDVLGKTPWEIGLLFDRENGERIASILQKERHIEAVEVPFRAKDGTVQICLYSATLITMQGELFLLSSVIDISGRKNMEEALRQANHKLNILSGITRHDINNQLQALGGYVELLRHKLPDPAHAEDFSRISRTIEQISNLIQFTKEYEMIGVHEPVWQNAHELVAAAEKAALPKAIRCENLLPYDLDIFADPLISKVFFNLLDNAKRHGGSIHQVRFTLEESDGARIIVCSDDGVGVPPADKERIFAPGVGKNTGFGLAISREILDITGIRIHETGMPGNGARFEITVPSGKHRTAAKE